MPISAPTRSAVTRLSPMSFTARRLIAAVFTFRLPTKTAGSEPAEEEPTLVPT